MKKKWLVTTITVLLTFCMQNVCAAIYSPETGVNSFDSSIEAEVEPIYSFSLPPDATITYPDKEVQIGNLVVGELFLKSEERLTITVIPGTMTGTANQSLKLNYEVYCNPPINLNASNSGEAYNITVKLHADELAKADVGRYKAALLFQVTSYPDEKVVWEGTTNVTVIKSGSKEDPVDPPKTSYIINWCVTAIVLVLLWFLWLFVVRYRFKEKRK